MQTRCWVLLVVVGRERLDVSGDGIGESVAEVDPGVPEPHAGHGGGQVHRGARLEVVGLVHRSERISLREKWWTECQPFEVFADDVERVAGPHVRNRVLTLIRWSRCRIRRTRCALLVRNRSE
jgi:hypothetical protein